MLWTRDEFLTICQHMLNGNRPSDFMMVYRDRADNPKFAKAQRMKAQKYVSWSWDTMTGKAKSKVGIGFYPGNQRGETRWGAMDFDAHDGNALRARELALSAFDVLNRQPQLFTILGTSGSDGWHLFAFAREFAPVADWTKLLKSVVATVGTEVKSGICEIFPDETKPNALPRGIRAPGTWNPKTDALGLIAHSSLDPILQEKRIERVYVFPYHSRDRVKALKGNDREEVPVFRGDGNQWALEFAIQEQATRAERLKVLVLSLFHQAGQQVAKENAKLQFIEKSVPTAATAKDHEAEFDSLWKWRQEQWL